MWFPLSPTLSNKFICSFESEWLWDCPNHFKPVFDRRYVDDIFALFSSREDADKFKEYLSSKHANIIFSLEKEKYGCLPFVDVNIFREKEKLPSNVYRKKLSVGFIPTSKVLYLKHITLV